MTVIAHFRIPADSFELGRILSVETTGSVELDTMVPVGERAVPFFSVSDEVREDFEETVGNHPAVENIVEVTNYDDKRLYSLDWRVSSDAFFGRIAELDGQILNASGTTNTWAFEIRFLAHEALGDFQECCSDADIPIELGRIYNPTPPESGMWYGLTYPQRDALIRAFQGGYYSIPRGMSTQDLADDLGISDQAVTERLRRAIMTLTESTLIAMQEEVDDEIAVEPDLD